MMDGIGRHPRKINFQTSSTHTFAGVPMRVSPFSYQFALANDLEGK